MILQHLENRLSNKRSADVNEAKILKVEQTFINMTTKFNLMKIT